MIARGSDIKIDNKKVVTYNVLRKGGLQMNKIKELRKEDNITVAELANIEAGNRNIKATDLKIIKELLGVSYQEFFAS